MRGKGCVYFRMRIKFFWMILFCGCSFIILISICSIGIRIMIR